MLAATQRLGAAGLVAPLALAGALTLLRLPVVALWGTVALALLFEGRGFGLFGFAAGVYDPSLRGFSVLDVLLAVAIAAVALDVLRRGAAPRLPRVVAGPLLVLALAIVGGAIVGHANGTPVREAVLELRSPVALLLIPLAVVNLGLPRDRIRTLLVAATVLAIVKAALGLVVVATGRGGIVEGTTLTYYEPVANWLVLLVLLGILALWISGRRPPVWALLGTPLLTASLLLSYRRSFWIGAALAIVLVVLLATSAAGRRAAVPVAAIVVVAVWAVWSFGLQRDTPIARRAESLAPGRLHANAEDRYRIDERANVLAELRASPVAGLGVGVQWHATERALSIDRPDGRKYVHMAALWYWLKLGVLGLVAYVGLVLAALALSWRVWRRAPDPVARAFGLASLAGMAGLAVIETTASFTGVDARFTVAIAAQLGLLAALASPR
jgi:O-antigen ligase